MSMLYEKCELCPKFVERGSASCPACKGTGFRETGLAIAQADRMARYATRIEIEPGDVVQVTRDHPYAANAIGIAVKAGSGEVHIDIAVPSSRGSRPYELVVPARQAIRVALGMLRWSNGICVPKGD